MFQKAASLILCPLFLVTPPSSECAIGATAEDATLAAFKDDCRQLEQTFSNGDLSRAWIQSASCLFTWSRYPDFLDLTDRICWLYRYLRPEDVNVELDKWSKGLEGTPNGLGLLATGLMAKAIGRHDDAARFLRSSLGDPTYLAKPFVHGLLGGELLELGHLQDATPEYEKAITLASEDKDPAFRFRLHQLYASDLFRKHYIDEAADVVISHCMLSDYPLEKAWALSQNALYYLSKNNIEIVRDSVTELKPLASTLVARSDLDWQRRKLEGITKTLDSVEKALSDDPLSKLISAVEALDYAYKAEDIPRALKSIQPYVDQYPLEAYSTWNDPKLKKWAVWAHHNYAACLSMMGHVGEAEEHFRRIIEYVPCRDMPDRVIDAWVWIGKGLVDEERYSEAQAALEKALSLDADAAQQTGTQFPIYMEKRYIKGGPLQKDMRELAASLYKHVLREQGLLENNEPLNR